MMDRLCLPAVRCRSNALRGFRSFCFLMLFEQLLNNQVRMCVRAERLNLERLDYGRIDVEQQWLAAVWTRLRCTWFGVRLHTCFIPCRCRAARRGPRYIGGPTLLLRFIVSIALNRRDALIARYLLTAYSVLYLNGTGSMQQALDVTYVTFEAC